MYLNKQERTMLERTLFNLRYDTDYAGQETEMISELSSMTDSDLEMAINAFVSVA